MARQQSQIELTSEEMLEISLEINQRFAPNVGSVIPGSIDLFFNESNLYTFQQPSACTEKALLYSKHDAHIGLSPEELYHISEEISRAFMPANIASSPELFLLPVDPDHLYAYWNLGECQEPFLAEKDSENELTLRIYWRPDRNNRITDSNVWFDIAVHGHNTQKKVRLPIDNSAYSAALGKVNADQSFDAYVHSNIIHVPPDQRRMAVPHLRVSDDASENSMAVMHGQGMADQAGTVSGDETAGFEARWSDFLEEQENVAKQTRNGWVVKLHFRQTATRGNERESIGSRFQEVLKLKDIDIQLIPEVFWSKKASHQEKTASGRGMIKKVG